jgi:hypothetical protein
LVPGGFSVTAADKDPIQADAIKTAINDIGRAYAAQ